MMRAFIWQMINRLMTSFIYFTHNKHRCLRFMNRCVNWRTSFDQIHNHEHQFWFDVFAVGLFGVALKCDGDLLCTDILVIEIEFVATNGTYGGQPPNRMRLQSVAAVQQRWKNKLFYWLINNNNRFWPSEQFRAAVFPICVEVLLRPLRKMKKQTDVFANALLLHSNIGDAHVTTQQRICFIFQFSYCSHFVHHTDDGHRSHKGPTDGRTKKKKQIRMIFFFNFLVDAAKWIDSMIETRASRIQKITQKVQLLRNLLWWMMENQRKRNCAFDEELLSMWLFVCEWFAFVFDSDDFILLFVGSRLNANLSCCFAVWLVSLAVLHMVLLSFSWMVQLIKFETNLTQRIVRWTNEIAWFSVSLWMATSVHRWVFALRKYGESILCCTGNVLLDNCIASMFEQFAI